MLEAIQQSELIDEDGSQSEAPGIGQALGGHLTMTVEDSFEVFVEVLNSCVT
jgi:hypothetical protein